jgi:ATP-dependent Clp protease adaptor protein ClpS
MAGNEGNSAKLANRREEKLREPEDFWVILLNDHYTTMDFVVKILISLFQKSEEEANQIMLDIHRKGQGLVGRYSRDIAMTKAAQVHAEAAKKEFPLRCIVERV